MATLLAEKKFQCYLDQYGSDVDSNAALLRRLTRSTVRVLVGTKDAIGSHAIKDELHAFKKTGRSIIPINVDGALERAEWIEIVAGSEAVILLTLTKPSG